MSQRTTHKQKKLPIKISLPEDFLEEESLCDYVVSTEMKEVWAIELDLLQELDRVCKKYNIKYYAEGGTLLGAIRHKGFIPWDDDIDVTMMRSDYEKLCMAGSEFEHPYFFQTEQTDPGSLRGHAQLRNSKTTGALTGEERTKINQGIFIDIFPMDRIPEDNHDRSIQAKRASRYKHLAVFFGKNINIISDKKNIKNLVKKTLTSIITEKKRATIEAYFYRKFENECIKYNQDSELKNLSLLCLDALRSNLYRSADSYRNQIMLPFEFLSIPAPVGYDEILNTLYGDYSKIVKGQTIHGGVLFSTDEPYNTFLKKQRLCENEGGEENDGNEDCSPVNKRRG